MPDLEGDEKVWIKTSVNDGAEGKVVMPTEQPDSYLVERDRQVIRRNRKHLIQLPTVPVSLERDASNDNDSQNVPDIYLNATDQDITIEKMGEKILSL